MLVTYLSEDFIKTNMLSLSIEIMIYLYEGLLVVMLI